MATDRELQETIARCVSALVFYHKCGRTGETSERMAAEVQLIAGYVGEVLHLAGDEIESRLVRPLEFELTERFGREVGRRLLGEFLAAFDCVTRLGGRPQLAAARVGRRGPQRPMANGTGVH